MKSLKVKFKRAGFTLIELLTAMAITAILVSVIMQLTLQGISLWKTVNDDVNTTSTARIALQTMAHDLESFQMKPGANDYEWFNARKDEENDASKQIDNKKNKSGKQKKRGAKHQKLSYVPDSACFVFFTCAPDRNPAVAIDNEARSCYRSVLATASDEDNSSFLGDVNAVGYRLVYKDHIQNKGADDKSEGVFPVFALYRHVVSREETFDNMLCKEDIYTAYQSDCDKKGEEQDVICDNIVEMNLTVNIEYVATKAADGKPAQKMTETVTVLSSNGSGKKISVKGDKVVVNGKEYPNARLVSAHISVTVLTEEGVAMVERMRQGKAGLLPPVDFFARYTRQFSTAVALPQPY